MNIRLSYKLIYSLNAKLLQHSLVSRYAQYYLLCYSKYCQFSTFDLNYACAACYLLAAKQTDIHVSMRRIALTLIEIQKLDVYEKLYRATVDGITSEELKILDGFNFDLTVECPENYIDTYANTLDLSMSNEVFQKVIKNAKFYCEDLYNTYAPVSNSALMLACVAMKMSLCYNQTTLSDMNGVPWYKWICSGVEKAEVDKLYTHSREELALIRKLNHQITLSGVYS